MAKLLFVGRKTLKDHEEALKPFLNVVPVQMAVALSPEDAELARKLTDAVATFNHTTAIIADFPADLIVNEDGTIEPLPLVIDTPTEPTLITEV
jgi:hypothetical protein